jgi:hypothetical protein
MNTDETQIKTEENGHKKAQRAHKKTQDQNGLNSNFSLPLLSCFVPFVLFRGHSVFLILPFTRVHLWLVFILHLAGGMTPKSTASTIARLPASTAKATAKPSTRIAGANRPFVSPSVWNALCTPCNRWTNRNSCATT